MSDDGGLRVLFRRHLPAVHWVTIESRYTQAGIPDINGCIRGVDFWVECKLARGWRVVFRPFQLGWLAQRLRAGGTCFVAVKRKDSLYLFAAREAPRLARESLNDCEALGIWHGGARAWDWKQVLALLLRREKKR